MYLQASKAHTLPTHSVAPLVKQKRKLKRCGLKEVGLFYCTFVAYSAHYYWLFLKVFNDSGSSVISVVCFVDRRQDCSMSYLIV